MSLATEQLPAPITQTDPAPVPPPPIVYITGDTGFPTLGLRELWRYRELMGFLALRDIKVRYKQTAIGVLWVLIQPLAATFAFTLFFGRLAKLNATTTTPYAVLVLAALLPWQLFAGAIDRVGNSMVNEQNLITKVYFPRLVIPLAGVLSGLVDFAIAFLLLLIMMACYHTPLRWAILTVPLFVLLAVVTALSVGLWLSALNVQYRDVRYAIPFLVQIWLFVTPVAYPISIVPAAWRTLYGLNPMVGVVEGFRWALLGNTDSPGATLLVSCAVTLMLLVGGLFYFRKMEETFADVV